MVRAELPGVGKDEIDVRVEDDTLILEGERKNEVESEQVATHRRERFFGHFSRCRAARTGGGNENKRYG